tara:strand:+ start:2808 stop:3689 length:882 start_codon:yes stop_codon:yes gene_type:complete
VVDSAIIKRKKCPFCNYKFSKIIYKKKLNSPEITKFLKHHLSSKFPFNVLNKKYFIVLECKNCTGIYQQNILNKKYNKIFYEEYVPQEDSFIKKKEYNKIYNKIYQSEIEYIKSLLAKENKINVLEIGAGWGLWSILAKKNNMNVTAIEIANVRRKFLKKNKINTYKSIKSVNKKFNLIYSDQTFEHLSNPLDYLFKLSKLLKPGGYIYLKVPPGIYIKRKLKKNYQFGDDEIIPLEHINVFNRKVNNLLAKKVGLKYIYPQNIYSYFSINFFIKNLNNFYEYISSKTIIFKK